MFLELWCILHGDNCQSNSLIIKHSSILDGFLLVFHAIVWAKSMKNKMHWLHDGRRRNKRQVTQKKVSHSSFVSKLVQYFSNSKLTVLAVARIFWTFQFCFRSPTLCKCRYLLLHLAICQISEGWWSNFLKWHCCIFSSHLAYLSTSLYSF